MSSADDSSDVRKSYRGGLKKGIDAEEARRKREQATVVLRKQKRDEQLQKRRNITGAPSMNNSLTPFGDSLSAIDGDRSSSSISAPQRTTEVREKLKMLPQLKEMINSNDPVKEIEGCMNFRKLLSIERNPPIQDVIDEGIVPKLVQFLRYNHNPTLQFEAAWALTNIASGTSKHTKVVIDHGAVPIFVELLRSSSDDVREQACWALGNIAGDSPNCRDLVLRHGAMQPLIELCRIDAKISLLRNATWTLSNLCRGKPQPEWNLVSSALPILSQLLHSKDDEVLTDACWALSYLSDDTGPHNQKIQAVIHVGVTRRLIDLLMNRNPNVKTPALRTIGNIVTGDDLQTQIVMNCNVLPCLLALLSNPKKGIRKEAAWTISNITAGNHEQIQAVMDNEIFPALVQILKVEEFDIQKEAAWAISNATSGGSDAQIRRLFAVGCLPPLCELLNRNDPKITMVALEGIENILRVGKSDQVQRGMTDNEYAVAFEQASGLDYLEELQKHENQEIYDKVVKIIKTYFDSVEDDNVNGPDASNDQFNFGVEGATMGGQAGFNFGHPPSS